MQGFFLNLRKFLLLGKETSKLRPSLGEFAITYEPTGAGADVQETWYVLQEMLGPNQVDAGLNGLLVFIRSNHDQDYARVCFSADCEIGFELNEGTLCIDPHLKGEQICCSPADMESAIETMLAAYDQQYA